ncbi:MAG: hypothetical protein ACK4OO_00455 [bacterium]
MRLTHAALLVGALIPMMVWGQPFRGPHHWEPGLWGEEPGWGKPPFPGPGLIGRCLVGIDLPADKKAELDKLLLEHQKKMVEAKSRWVELHTKFRLALISDSPNPKEIEEIAKNWAKMKEEAVKQQANLIQKVRVLVPQDQRARFDQNFLHQSPRKKGGEGWGWWGGPGGRCCWH